MRPMKIRPQLALFALGSSLCTAALAALAGWIAAAPEDPKLAETLRTLTNDRNRGIREDAVKKLASLHHQSDIALLRELANDPDPTIAYFAKSGADETESFLTK
jgi:hypothetical protein